MINLMIRSEKLCHFYNYSANEQGNHGVSSEGVFTNPGVAGKALFCYFWNKARHSVTILAHKNQF